MAATQAPREHWGSMLGFILAAAGSAIGLGNIWKFPYITGLNGGGAFVLVYFLCIFLLGTPILLCELLIGRRTQQNAYGAFKSLQQGRSPRLAYFLGAILVLCSAVEFGAGSYFTAFLALVFAVLFFTLKFATVGLTSILVGSLILSYYSMIGGWALMYVIKLFRGDFNFAENLHRAATPEAVSALSVQTEEMFSAFTHNWPAVLCCQIVFMLLASFVVISGVKKGIEFGSKILMPLLFFLLLVVILRGVTLPGAEKGVEFFLKPDFSKLTAGGVLEALGHAFFSLSLGMAITITYGSYLAKNQNLFKSSCYVIILDTVASIMGGLAIFPAVFAMGFSPAGGPGLIFKVLPATFGSFPGNMGWLWGGLFFVMLSIAALTSAISLLEIAVAFLMDEFKWSRRRSTMFTSVAVTALGILSCLSFESWSALSGIHGFLARLVPEESLKSSFFDLLDYLCSNWTLPLNGILTALFVGWVWTTRRGAHELRRGASGMSDVNLISYCAGLRGDRLYSDTANRGLTLITLWSLLVRFVAPVVIGMIFLRAIGITLGIE